MTNRRDAPGHPAELLLATLQFAPQPDTEALAAAWRRVDERGLASLVEYERAAQWLLRRLGETGLREVAPRRLADQLRVRSRAETVSGMVVDAEAEAVIRLLAERNVPVVLLKGTARRAAAGLYPYADARATSDVDLLLPGDLVTPTWNQLRAEGFTFATDPAATPVGHYHPPPLIAPGGGVAIELHSSTSRTVSPSEAWTRANVGGRNLQWHGLDVRVPGTTDLLWHALIHGLTHGAFGFRLRYLLDAAVVLATSESVDWDRIAARIDSEEVECQSHARAWLGAAARLAGRALPAAVTAGVPPFALARALAWRLAVVRRWPGHQRLMERMVEESVRVELDQPAMPTLRGTSPYRRMRRRLSALAARFAYQGWRAGNVASSQHSGDGCVRLSDQIAQ